MQIAFSLIIIFLKHIYINTYVFHLFSLLHTILSGLEEVQ